MDRRQAVGSSRAGVRRRRHGVTLNPRAHFFGDSFTSGQGDPEFLGWVGRLAPLATGVDFANHGVPGAPGEFIVEQWFSTTPDPQRVELAVFCFGTNDAVLQVPAVDSLAAQQRALDRAEELHVPVFWIGPPPIGDMPDEDAALRELSGSLCAAAESRGAPAFETFDLLGEGSEWRREASAGDGSHPGADGYAELARLLEDAGLVEWLLGTGR